MNTAMPLSQQPPPQQSQQQQQPSAQQQHEQKINTQQQHNYFTNMHMVDGVQEEERNRPFMCSVCSATYKTRTHLRRHMFVHLSSRPYPCNECGKGFNRKEHLNKHIEAVHSGTKYECGFCGKEISRKDHLNRHIKNMHSSLTCTVNGNNGTGNVVVNNNGHIGVPAAQQHQQSVSGQQGNMIKVNLPCALKQKAQLSFLTPNQQSSTNAAKSRQKVMPQFKTKVSTPGTLQNQQAVANVKITNHFTGNKKLVFQVYSCTECNSTFTTEKDFNIHSRTHKPQPYKCTECPRAYTRREKLTEHIRCFHQGQKFACDYCQKTLSRKDHVLRHVRSVHPEVLANRFVSMAEDMDTQSRLLNYNSNSASTSSQQGGSGSSATALGEMNILLRSVCHICLKVFGTSYHLSRHMESCHNGDIRPYNCTACSKQFKRKDHLTKHMKSHCPSYKKMNEIESNGIDAIESLQILMSSPDEEIQENDSKLLNDIFGSSSGNNGTNKSMEGINQGSDKRMEVSHMYNHDNNGNGLNTIGGGSMNVSMYPCGHCQKEFTDRNRLIQHVQEHNGNDIHEKLKSLNSNSNPLDNISLWS